MTDPLAGIDRLTGWFRDSAAPLWARAGWDTRHGGFFEALDFNGEAIRGDRRVRVQARQVYTFSMIGAHGWSDRAESIAAKGFDYLIERACPDGAARGCAHVLSDDGKIIDERRDLYDQAFLLMACAGRIAAANCDRALMAAQRTLAFLDRELSSPHGGWNENENAETPRRQNPHMHLFEAFITLFQTTGDEIWRDKAASVFALFTERFYDPAERVLIEFLTSDLKSRDAQRGDEIEPGHMMEWVWLLGNYATVSGADQRESMTALYQSAQSYCDADGFLPDKVSTGALSGARRLWPQTEYIKAAFRLSAAPDDQYARDGAMVIDKLFATYFQQPVAGLWCDQYDGDGAPIAADVPASILYHLYEAVAESMHFANGGTKR